MDTILKIIITIAIIAHVVIAGVFSVAFIGQSKTKAINEVKYQCAMSVRYEVTSGGKTISYPPEDLYKKCLQDKGLN